MADPNTPEPGVLGRSLLDRIRAADPGNSAMRQMAGDMGQQDPREVALVNGWETIGEIPELWMNAPGRPQPQPDGTTLAWQRGQQGQRQESPQPQVDFQRVAAENAALKAKLAEMEAAKTAVDFDTAVERAAREMKLPEGWANLPPEQQEQARAKALLAALKPILGTSQKAPAQPATDPALAERLQEIEMRQRFGQLSAEQLNALKGIAQTRKPANDQELIALASVAHPELFPTRAQAAGFVAPPGRGMPSRQGGKPGYAELAQATRENRGNRFLRDRLGAAALRALAEEDPQLFTRGV